jgi:hypothetical protein
LRGTAAQERREPDDTPRFAVNPAQPRRLLRFSLLRQLQSVFYLDPEVANRAFELCVAQEKLHGAQILGSSTDQRRLGAADGMGSISGRIEPDFLDPGVHNSSIVSGAQMRDARMRLGNRKSSDARPDRLIQSTKAVRVVSVISNCTGLEVFCCTTIARAATRSP